MEKFTVDGIVIKTAVTGENDLIIWVLTRNRGLIRAFAKGARGVKSRFHAAASQFAYSTCTFSEKNGVYNLSEAEIKNMFIELRNSLSVMTCAQYFCEVLLKTLPEGSDGEFYLRLLLNSLYLLCKGEKPVLLIKSVFELRLAAEDDLRARGGELLELRARPGPHPVLVRHPEDLPGRAARNDVF